MSGQVLVALAVGIWAVGVSAREPMATLGDAALSVVQDVPGYNSWPMIQAAGGKLICAYSKGSAHTIDEGKRGVYARTSADGGKSWSPEVCVVNDPAVGEVTIGKGLDGQGAMLLWVRNWGKVRRHDLYRPTDGVTFEKIASPDLSPMPMQITDIFQVPGKGMMALWFAGDYREGPRNAWGLLTSADNGRTWIQRTVEKDLEKSDWPTEPSGVWLGDGRILVVARSEGNGPQFQITSTDSGATWKRVKTNITDVLQSTPSLLYDPESGRLWNCYYHRGARKLKRRIVDAAMIFDHPMAWPEPEVLAEGFEKRPYDAGNVNATILGGRHYMATYTGTEHDTATVVISVPVRPSGGQ